jgi:hypothetical protein
VGTSGHLLPRSLLRPLTADDTIFALAAVMLRLGVNLSAGFTRLRRERAIVAAHAARKFL